MLGRVRAGLRACLSPFGDHEACRVRVPPPGVRRGCTGGLGRTRWTLWSEHLLREHALVRKTTRAPYSFCDTGNRWRKIVELARHRRCGHQVIRTPAHISSASSGSALELGHRAAKPIRRASASCLLGTAGRRHHNRQPHGCGFRCAVTGSVERSRWRGAFPGPDQHGAARPRVVRFAHALGFSGGGVRISARLRWVHGRRDGNRQSVWKHEFARRSVGSGARRTCGGRGRQRHLFGGRVLRSS